MPAASDEKVKLKVPDNKGRPVSGIRLFRDVVDKIKVIVMDAESQSGAPVAIGEWIDVRLGKTIDEEYEAALRRMERRRAARAG